MPRADALVVHTDRVTANERLRDQSRASTDAIRVQLAAGKVAGAICGKRAHGRRNRGDRSVALDPGESKGIVALERRVVVRRCGRAWGWGGVGSTRVGTAA